MSRLPVKAMFLLALTLAFAFLPGYAFASQAQNRSYISDFAITGGSFPSAVSINKTFQVSVTVRNNGPFAGSADVVLESRDCQSKPCAQSKETSRITLQPGESKTVNFQVTATPSQKLGWSGVGRIMGGYMNIVAQVKPIDRFDPNSANNIRAFSVTVYDQPKLFNTTYTGVMYPGDSQTLGGGWKVTLISTETIPNLNLVQATFSLYRNGEFIENFAINNGPLKQHILLGGFEADLWLAAPPSPGNGNGWVRVTLIGINSRDIIAPMAHRPQ